MPAVLNRELLDEVIAVEDEDAIEMARTLARREGVLAGISCGRGRVGAPCRSPRGRSSAAPGSPPILPDSGERYVSTPFFAPDDASGERPRRLATLHRCARPRR